MVEQCLPSKIHVHLKPMNVTLIGKRVLRDTLILRCVHPRLEWALNPMPHICVERDLETRDTWRQKLERCGYKSRNTKDYWQPQELSKGKKEKRKQKQKPKVGKDSPLELQRKQGLPTP